MRNYTYYLDLNDGMVRRYPDGSEDGQKWDALDEKWGDRGCCPRAGCIATPDYKMTDAEASAFDVDGTLPAGQVIRKKKK